MGKVDKDTLTLFAIFVDITNRIDVMWDLRREASWTVDGPHTMDADGYLLDLEDIPDEHKKIRKGYTVSVDLQGLSDEDGDERVFDTLNQALITGIKIAKVLEEEMKEEEG